MNTILRAQALREMDISETPDGKQHCFSIKFEKKDGELVFLPRAVKTGLRFSMNEHRMRGVLPVDQQMNRIGHVYPVHIDNIYEYNNQIVKL